MNFLTLNIRPPKVIGRHTNKKFAMKDGYIPEKIREEHS